MFMLLGGSEKKAKKETVNNPHIKEARDIFNMGRFPVVTTQIIEHRPIAKVLGLVCCRGFDSDEAFFGMAAMAVKKGAQGIIGYNENIAFHPDGSKYFSCFGTAVMFQRDGRSDLLTDKRTIKDTLNMIPNAPAPGQGYIPDTSRMASQVNAEEPNMRGLSATGMARNMESMARNMEGMTAQNYKTERTSNSAQIAAQLVAEERMIAANNAMQTENGKMSQQPTEDEDPVLQRLLAAQKRQATQNWQQ